MSGRGCEGGDGGPAGPAEELQRTRLVEGPWEGPPQRVKAPYAKVVSLLVAISQVPRDTRNPVGSWEDHFPRLNTFGDR
jgi:hypothetical protein